MCLKVAKVARVESILQEIVAINQSLTDKEKKMELTKNCVYVCEREREIR